MLRAVINNLDEVAETIREHYVKKDGKFVLGVTPAGGFELDNVDGLRSALSQERADNTELKKLNKAFDGITDPKAALEALGKMEEIAGWDKDEKTKETIEANRRQILGEWEGKQTAWETEKVKLMGALQKNVVENAAVKAIEKAGGNAKLLWPHIAKETRMVENSDGSFGVEVLDENGNPKIIDSAGNKMQVGALVEKYKDTFPAAFKGTGSSGGGATGGQSGGDEGGTPTGTVSAGDQDGLNANIDGIASGKVQVVE